jgi:hypothetical protein
MSDVTCILVAVKLRNHRECSDPPSLPAKLYISFDAPLKLGHATAFAVIAHQRGDSIMPVAAYECCHMHSARCEVA